MKAFDDNLIIEANEVKNAQKIKLERQFKLLNNSKKILKKFGYDLNKVSQEFKEEFYHPKMFMQAKAKNIPKAVLIKELENAFAKEKKKSTDALIKKL